MKFDEFCQFFRIRRGKTALKDIGEQGKIACLFISDALDEKATALYGTAKDTYTRYSKGERTVPVKAWQEIKEYLSGKQRDMYVLSVSLKLKTDAALAAALKKFGLTDDELSDVDVTTAAEALTDQMAAFAEGNGEAPNIVADSYRRRIKGLRGGAVDDADKTGNQTVSGQNLSNQTISVDGSDQLDGSGSSVSTLGIPDLSDPTAGSQEENAFAEKRTNDLVTFAPGVQIDSGGKILVAGTPIAKTRTFSSEAYNLFVGGRNEKVKGAINLKTDRVLTEYTDRFTSEEYLPLTKESVAKLMRLPAIICDENNIGMHKAGDEQQAMYGFIRDIQDFSYGVTAIHFQVLQTFPQQVLNDLADELEIENLRGEMTRTHWTIKRIDLVETLRTHGIHLARIQ